MVFEITAAGFGSGDIQLHWGVGKQSLGHPLGAWRSLGTAEDLIRADLKLSIISV